MTGSGKDGEDDEDESSDEDEAPVKRKAPNQLLIEVNMHAHMCANTLHACTYAHTHTHNIACNTSCLSQSMVHELC